MSAQLALLFLGLEFRVGRILAFAVGCPPRALQSSREREVHPAASRVKFHSRFQLMQSFLDIAFIKRMSSEIEVWLCERRIENKGLLEQTCGMCCQLFGRGGFKKCRTVSFVTQSILG